MSKQVGEGGAMATDQHATRSLPTSTLRDRYRPARDAIALCLTAALTDFLLDPLTPDDYLVGVTFLLSRMLTSVLSNKQLHTFLTWQAALRA